MTAKELFEAISSKAHSAAFSVGSVSVPHTTVGEAVRLVARGVLRDDTEISAGIELSRLTLAGEGRYSGELRWLLIAGGDLVKVLVTTDLKGKELLSNVRVKRIPLRRIVSVEVAAGAWFNGIQTGLDAGSARATLRLDDGEELLIPGEQRLRDETVLEFAAEVKTGRVA